MPIRQPDGDVAQSVSPTNATLRPQSTAPASKMICWMRCRWLAKQAVMMRRSRCGGLKRPAKDAADVALAGCVAGFLGVGRVGERHADAVGLGELTDREVGAPIVDGCEVELEVAGVQDEALRGVHGDGVGVGHAVGDGDELDVEGTDARGRCPVRR